MAENNNTVQITKDEIESELKMLKSSWEMYEKTKAETLEKRTTKTDKNGNPVYSEKSTSKTIQLLETMQEDIKQKYIMLGGNVEDLKTTKKRGAKSKDSRKKIFDEILKKEKKREMNGDFADDIDITKPSEEISDSNTQQELSFFADTEEPNGKVETEEDDGTAEGFKIDLSKAKGKNIKYDVIPLPSKGECYKNRMSKIPVSYLTAYDENMIIAPNMYKDGTFLDYMLKAKIMTDEIDPNDMLPGDRDAVILWLRASGYGNEFPVTATDSNTGQQFQTTVDLSKLKYKKFTLKGDSNGHFLFTLPITGDKVKFKFLTYGEIKELDKIETDEISEIKKSRINEIADSIDDIIANDGDMERSMKLKLSDAAKSVREYSDSISSDDDPLMFSHSITNRMTASIVSVNGITDRKYIEEYVMYMNVRDSSALRKYITDNEPGVDFNIEIERPESLGGGSTSMFLSIDQYVFLTIA